MPHDFMPGLAGVPAARSSVSDVDGERGVLEYRGIRVDELCAKSSFLETASLLMFGPLPSQSDLNQFVGNITIHRRTTYRIQALIKCKPEQSQPMYAMQSPVADLRLIYTEPND